MNNIHILLVEDNEGDILLTTEALTDGKIQNKVSVCRDGKEAIDFLEKNGDYRGTEAPDLVLLDVNLPRKNGHEVLQYIKGHDHLKQIPVVMLTTSSSERDIDLSYRNHAHSYITKPVNAAQFLEVVTRLDHFRINIVKLSS